jgi:Tfp pilus assembly protein PilZ
MDLQEKRQTPRIETDLRFISCSSDISTDSRITDMSTTGAFIETSEPLPIDAELDLHLQLPGDSDIMSIDARVVWRKTIANTISAGMGIQFTNILPKHQEKLAAFIEQNYQANSSREQTTVDV